MNKIFLIIALIVVIGSIIVLVDVGSRLFDGQGYGKLSNDTVDLTIVDCVKRGSNTMEINVQLSNTNNHEVIVEWHAFGQDSQKNNINGVQGYAKIPARTIIDDKNYVDSFSYTSGCMAKIVSVRGT